VELIRLAYVVGFGLAGAGCLLSLRRTSRIEAPETRRGLAGLLALSGVWGLTHVARLLTTDPDAQVAAYTVGLTVGLATVGAWLYFCSAYTGREYHRRTWIRQAALAAYLLTVGMKLTNPIHGQYFTTAMTRTPFPHVTIQLGTFHWTVTGLSYALSAVGFYLLYEMLSESRSDVTALWGLAGAMALPAGLYALSVESPLLVLHYEPLGVAVFAVGALYAVDEQFVAVPRFWRNEVIDGIDEIVVLVDRERTVRDANSAAVEAFPQLADGVGRRLDVVAPELAAALDDESDVFSADRGRRTGYYLLDSTPLGDGPLDIGRALVCTDVTDVERQRRELDRQNEQFDDFRAAVTHELRNTLAIADGYLDLVTDRLAEETVDVRDATRQMEHSLDRMEQVVADLSTLARYGRTVEEVAECDLESAVERPHDAVGTDVETEVEPATIAADEGRLVELFRSALQLAAERGGTRLVVDPVEDGFTITTDAEPLSPSEVDRAFEYGEAVPSAETGMVFPMIETLARVHGWSVAVDTAYGDGVRVRIDGVDVLDRDPDATAA